MPLFSITINTRLSDNQFCRILEALNMQNDHGGREDAHRGTRAAVARSRGRPGGNRRVVLCLVDS